MKILLTILLVLNILFVFANYTAENYKSAIFSAFTVGITFMALLKLLL